MTAFIVFLALIALFAWAGVLSARDMRPERRPRNWSVGALITPRH